MCTGCGCGCGRGRRSSSPCSCCSFLLCCCDHASLYQRGSFGPLSLLSFAFPSGHDSIQRIHTLHQGIDTSIHVQNPSLGLLCRNNNIMQIMLMSLMMTRRGVYTTSATASAVLTRIVSQVRVDILHAGLESPGSARTTRSNKKRCRRVRMIILFVAASTTTISYVQ